MTAVSLMRGCVGTAEADFEVTLPVNLEPIVISSGISDAYLRSAMGCTTFATGSGTGRGGVFWGGVLYRVMGTTLYSVSPAGVLVNLGDVGAGGLCAFAIGFDRIAINSGNRLYYWNPTIGLLQVTDVSLSNVVDMLWMSGYYITTDGTYIITTNLSDPTTINPLHYGSNSNDPNPIVGLYTLRDELYVLSRYKISVFTEAGGSGFPFEVQTGATIPVGCVGPRAKAPLLQSFAFTGSALNEAASVYLCGSGSATKISTRTIDDELAATADLSSITMETRVGRNEQRLYVHLPTKSLVYLAGASTKLGEPVWYIVASGRNMDEPYRPRNAVLAYGKLICDDTATYSLGVLSDDVLPPTGETSVFMSMTRDGETYSPERAISAGALGDRSRRVQWRPHARASQKLGLKFRGQAGSQHFGEACGWSVVTPLQYNSARGFIIDSAELVGLPGHGVVGWASLEVSARPLSN